MFAYVLKQFQRSWDNPGPDEGYSWFIAFGCWLICFCTVGVVRSSGVLYRDMMIRYNVPSDIAAVPFSVNLAVKFMFGIFVGYFLEHFTCQQVSLVVGLLAATGFYICYMGSSSILCFTIGYGFIFGLAHAAAFPVAFAMISKYFVRFRTTGNGLALCGVTIGGMILPVLIQYFLDEYDASGAYLILSGLVSHVLIGASLLRPHAPKIQPQPELITEKIKIYESENSKLISKVTHLKRFKLLLCPVSLSSVFQDSRFYYICAGSVFMQVSNQLIPATAVTHMDSVGAGKSLSVLSVVIYHVGDLLGPILFSFLSDKGVFEPATLSIFLLITKGCVVVLCGVFESAHILLALFLVTGVLSGPFLSVRNTVLARQLGSESVAFSTSIISFVCGLASAISPYLIRLVNGGSLNFGNFYITLGFLVVIGGIIWSFDVCLDRFQSKSVQTVAA